MRGIFRTYPDRYVCEHGAQGMQDKQLDELIEVFKRGRIFAVNLGENRDISPAAWQRLAYALPQTKLGFMFVEVRHCLVFALQNMVLLLTTVTSMTCFHHGLTACQLAEKLHRTAPLTQSPNCTMVDGPAGRICCMRWTA